MAKAKAASADTDTGTVTYKTVEKKSAMFDILVKGETIPGQWNEDRSAIVFVVPVELVDGFEQHWHFQAGNIVKA